MAAVLRLSAVTKRFGRLAAVDDVSLTVEEGEVVSLLGPSGCGKTTLLRIIAGLVAPDNGAIELDGVDITAVPPNRRPVNTIFQNYALFPHLSVAENIAFGPRAASWERARIDSEVTRLLELVRLPGMADRKPATLSGGQKQRVAIARALILQPRVLLLDEPFAALDRHLRRELLEELLRLHRALKLTFVFVTHDQGEAMHLSDRIAVMDAGRMRQLGTPDQLYDQPADAFTARFFGDANLCHGRVIEKDANQVVLDVSGVGTFKRTKAPNMPPVSTGESVWFCLRPEHLHWSAHPRAAANQAEAEVISSVFQGNAWRCNARVGDASWVLQLPRTERSSPPAAGDRGWLSWSADCGWLGRVHAGNDR